MPKLSEIIIEVKQIERKIAFKQNEIKELQARLSDLTEQDVTFEKPEVDEGQHQASAPKKRTKKVIEPSETKAKTNNFLEQSGYTV